MTTKRIHVRLAEESDRDAVTRVLLDAYGQYETVLNGERWEHYKASIFEAIDTPNTIARFVAELEGRVVGSVFVYGSSEEAYGNPALQIHNPIIRLLGVSREARGRGVATELIRASVKLAKGAGAESLHLHTSDMMDSAIRLYERLRFERAYDKEFYVGDILVKSYRVPLAETVLLEA